MKLPGFLSLVKNVLVSPARCAASATGAVCQRLRGGPCKKQAQTNGEESGSSEDLSGEPRDRLFRRRQQILDIFSRDRNTLLANDVRVEHLMSRRLLTVAPEAPARKVTKLMQGKRVRHMLVCEGERCLLGIISDRDLHFRKSRTARGLMTPSPLVVRPDALVSPAITMMLDRHISCLPVVDEHNRLVGVLTSTDLMMSLQCTLQALARLAANTEQPSEAIVADPSDSEAECDPQPNATSAATVPLDQPDSPLETA